MKYCGKIGFIETAETRPGLWSENQLEKTYFGDVQRNAVRWQNGQGINDNILINNQISILADDYALNNIHHIRYIEFQGAKWQVTNIDIQRPRLILTLGGLYNA